MNIKRGVPSTGLRSLNTSLGNCRYYVLFTAFRVSLNAIANRFLDRCFSCCHSFLDPFSEGHARQSASFADEAVLCLSLIFLWLRVHADSHTHKEPIEPIIRRFLISVTVIPFSPHSSSISLSHSCFIPILPHVTSRSRCLSRYLHTLSTSPCLLSHAHFLSTSPCLLSHAHSLYLSMSTTLPLYPSMSVLCTLPVSLSLLSPPSPNARSPMLAGRCMVTSATGTRARARRLSSSRSVG